MKFARYIFLIAGVYGLAVLVPQFFLEARIGADYPPAITHPENFYGFIGVASVFQVVFLTIASDPVRFRPLMLASVAEKFVFAIAVYALFAQGRVPGVTVVFGSIDLVLGTLFTVCYFLTPGRPPEGG